MANPHKELDRLAAGIRRCVKCRLCRERTHAVPGEGPAGAAVFFLGEAPGRNEDAAGRPFVGLAGRTLNRLLALAGLNRPDVFITSCVKCRPPHNRLPRADELTICKQAWLLEQVRLVNPRIVVLLGATAIRQLLGRDVFRRSGIPARHAGRPREVGQVCPTYCLRSAGLPAREIPPATPIARAGRPALLRQLHGQIIRRDDRDYLLTFHPAAARGGKQVVAMMEADFRLLGKLAGSRS